MKIPKEKDSEKVKRYEKIISEINEALNKLENKDFKVESIKQNPYPYTVGTICGILNIAGLRPEELYPEVNYGKV